MALKRAIYYLLAALLLFAGGCKSVRHLSSSQGGYEWVRDREGLTADDDIVKMIAPIKAQLDDKMNTVIGEVAFDLTKKKPESTLGNWICDAMMDGAQKEGYSADIAISNYGGIRVPYITAGPLTVGELYELSPFDNLMVIVEVPGQILDSLFQQIALTEGWPVSRGIRMVIQEKKMTECTVLGMPLVRDKIYNVLMPDYVANGGDGLGLLIPLARVQTGLLVRDVLIRHAKDTQLAGQKIEATLEGRISIKP